MNNIKMLATWMVLGASIVMLMTPAQDIHIKATESPGLSTQSTAKPIPQSDTTLEPPSQKKMDVANGIQDGGLDTTGSDEKDSVLISDIDDDNDSNNKGQDFDNFYCDSDSGICNCIGVDDCVKMALSGQCKEGTWKPIDGDAGECNWNV